MFFFFFLLFLRQRSDHFLACCCSSCCGLGERFKVIVPLTLSFHIPRFPSCHPCSHHFLYSPCYSDMSIQLTFSFPGPRLLSPSWSYTPLSKSSCCVNSFFLPPGEPNNEIPFGNQDLSAWRDVHVFYLFKALLWPVFFFCLFFIQPHLCAFG